MMKRRLDDLSENVSRLGAAGLDLAKAEANALSGELKLSAKALLRVLLLAALCASLLFWGIAVLILLGIEVSALWLPRWGATLLMLGLLLLVVLAVGLFVRKRLRALETPATTVRRRLEDHIEWWQSRIVRRD